LQIYQQGGFFYVHSPQPYAQYNLTNIFWGLDNDVLAFKWKIPNDSDHYYFFVTTNIPPTTAYQNYSLGVVLLCYETNKFYIPNDANDDLQEITFDTSLLINKNETFFFGTVTGTVITQYETGGVTSLNQKFAGFRNALTPHRTAGVYYLGGTDDTTGMIAGDFVITDDPTAPGFRFIFLCAPLAEGVENDFVYTNGALKAAINPTTYVPSILDPVPTATNPWRLVSFAPSDGSILGWQTGPFDGSKSFLRRD
jgi:hypothetical protein